jgi:hypothetical protein
MCAGRKDEPRAQMRVYISRPTTVAGVSSARRFLIFVLAVATEEWHEVDQLARVALLGF